MIMMNIVIIIIIIIIIIISSTIIIIIISIIILSVGQQRLYRKLGLRATASMIKCTDTPRFIG